MHVLSCDCGRLLLFRPAMVCSLRCGVSGRHCGNRAWWSDRRSGPCNVGWDSRCWQGCRRSERSPFYGLHRWRGRCMSGFARSATPGQIFSETQFRKKSGGREREEFEPPPPCPSRCRSSRLSHLRSTRESLPKPSIFKSLG